MPITTKRIVYSDDDGQLHIVIPAPECGLTVEQIQAKDVPTGKTSYIVEKSIFPTERHFRDAWRYTPD
tara:strand:- start:132 stop:335 length:204 start_codon:yes stop_codon:yes gene_type:complete